MVRNTHERDIHINVLKELIAERIRVIHVWTAFVRNATPFEATIYNECIHNFSSYNNDDQEELDALLSHH